MQPYASSYSYPSIFMEKVSEKLKPGGKIIIQDIYTGCLMKMVLRMMRHEGWSDAVDIYDCTAICNNPYDPWSANCSIPKLLFFENPNRFETEFPMYRVLKKQRNECLLFLLSGGVIAETFHLPLRDDAVVAVQKIDKILLRYSPAFFCMWLFDCFTKSEL